MPKPSEYNEKRQAFVWRKGSLALREREYDPTLAGWEANVIAWSTTDMHVVYRYFRVWEEEEEEEAREEDEVSRGAKLTQFDWLCNGRLHRASSRLILHNI
jgi:hypothetical protein